MPDSIQKIKHPDPKSNGEPAPIIEIEYPSYAELETYITNRAMAEIRSIVDDEKIADA